MTVESVASSYKSEGWLQEAFTHIEAHIKNRTFITLFFFYYVYHPGLIVRLFTQWQNCVNSYEACRLLSNQ